MKAVLVGAVSSDKLYYILDAEEFEKDAVLVRPDNSMVKLDLFDFCNSCSGLVKIRTSKFHKFLWDGISYKNSDLWRETFLSKKRPVPESMLFGLDIYSSLGKNKKKIDSVNSRVKNFNNKNSKQTKPLKKKDGLQTKSEQPCCADEMVEFYMPNLVFDNEKSRKEAWVAMTLLRQIEE